MHPRCGSFATDPYQELSGRLRRGFARFAPRSQHRGYVTLLLHFLEIRIDDVFLGTARLRSASVGSILGTSCAVGTRLRAGALLRLASLAVHRLGELV